MAKVLYDSTAVQTLRYLRYLAVIFVQGLPFLRQAHPDHQLCTQHRVILHPQYNDWEALQISHCSKMHTLDRDLHQKNKLGSFDFTAVYGA